jgi:hypothetical protein
MSMKSSCIGALGALLFVITPTVAAEEKSGRYTMSPTEGGFVRLDTESGEVAFCKRGPDGGWACEAMPDTQMAMRRDMDRLRQENEALRNSAPGGPADEQAPIAPGGESAGRIPIPTEQDVDRLFDYVEGMARKLKQRMKRLEEQHSDRGTPL